MRIILQLISILLLWTSVSIPAVENLDELSNRKIRKQTNTYYSGENSSDGYKRQPECLVYNDITTDNPVVIMSSSPYATAWMDDISPGNPWSADGARIGFFSNRPVPFTRTGSGFLGATPGTPFIVSSDGSNLRVAIDAADRTWGTTGFKFFIWNPVLRDIFYTTGGKASGLSLDGSGIYKNTVADSSISYQKIVDLPGVDSDNYTLFKIISPDGKYILPTKNASSASTVFYPVSVFPTAALLDSDGYPEQRGILDEWGQDNKTLSSFACRHDGYFPGRDFFVSLFSFDCTSVNPIFYKFNLTGSAADGGPLFDASESAYATFGSKEVEPLWTNSPAYVPWRPTGMSGTGYFWGHPAFDRWGRIVAYADGNARWANNSEGGGPVTWDYRNRDFPAFPGATVSRVLYEKSHSHRYTDWSAWSDYFVFSSGGIPGGTYSDVQYLRTAKYDSPATTNDGKLIAYHYGDVNSSLYYTYQVGFNPHQSPDGTKVAYNIQYIQDSNTKGDIAYATAYHPHPPEITSVTGSGTYTIRFDWRLATTPRGYTTRGWPNEATNNPPPPRETKLFRLWRSANGVSGWTPAGTVNAEIFERYNFQTGEWSGNDYWTITDTPGAGTWHYAVTAVEHSGLESRTLSNVFSAAGAQTAAYPSDPKWKSNFCATFQPSLIRHYNIYAKDGSTPAISRQTRIASIPVASGKSYVDWLGNTDGSTKYAVTAVDTQGNESTARALTFAHTATPGQYSLSWGDSALARRAATFSGKATKSLSGAIATLPQ